MDLSFLDHLTTTTDTVAALLFLPFVTKIIYFESLVALLAEYFPNPCNPHLQLPVHGHRFWNQVDIYVGDQSPIRLGNLWRFLDFNKLDTVNVGTCYTFAIAVGRNRLSGMEVDIPPSGFPWVSDFFGIVDNPFFFVTRPQPNMRNPHVLRLTCRTCKLAKKRCLREGMPCNTCHKACIPCVPNQDEDQRRRRETANECRKNIDVLCPLHQYTINLFVRRCHGDSPLAATSMAALGAYVQTNTLFQDNTSLEIAVKEYVNSYQKVAFVEGELRLVEEKEMTMIWGFEVGNRWTHKLDKISLVTPHLGMHKPLDAYSLIDAALGNPGELFYVDLCVLDKAFEPRAVRIVALGATHSATHVQILLGWKFA